ncbi:MAG TPA: hypothetical protein VFQ61_09960, partial [Polyangiaceae bacterium]|nr:hypothetical protein [Polyangiaceae bacterium]
SWSKENAALEADRNRALEMSQIPSLDPSLRQRASANDDLLSSIRLVDAVDVAMLTSGALALGVGAYLTLAPSPGSKPVQLRAASPGQFRLEYQF